MIAPTRCTNFSNEKWASFSGMRLLHRLDGAGSVKAFVDIRVGGITIKGAKIIQQPDRRAWLGMPAVKTERAWHNVVEITSAKLRQAITEVVLAG